MILKKNLFKTFKDIFPIRDAVDVYLGSGLIKPKIYY